MLHQTKSNNYNHNSKHIKLNDKVEVSLGLYTEILDFCDLISPSQLEQQSRAMAVQRVSNVIKSIWKQCQVV